MTRNEAARRSPLFGHPPPRAADDQGGRARRPVLPVIRRLERRTCRFRGGALLVGSPDKPANGRNESGHRPLRSSPSRTTNPALPESLIARELERDPARARAECLAEFRDDVEAFVPRELVESPTSPGVRARPARAGTRHRAFVDPSGGVSDSFTLAIAHAEPDGRRVLDLVKEVRPPFSPESAVAELAALLHAYRVTSVTGDRYGGEWPREAFRRHGIRYEPASRARSELYLELLPLLTAGRVELLDEPRLIAQLAGLERRKGRTGRDTIDHAPGGHDDLANAAAGALTACGARRLLYVGGPPDDPPADAAPVPRRPAWLGDGLGSERPRW